MSDANLCLKYQLPTIQMSKIKLKKNPKLVFQPDAFLPIDFSQGTVNTPVA